MSTIETPPLNRLPVETVVCGYDERIIRDAINRELERQGQVFFLHNRVQSIQRMRDKIADLCPNARVDIGHGQMDADELEAVMERFVAGKIDVLVCTTIIESGLDIPNANTIIIDRRIASVWLIFTNFADASAAPNTRLTPISFCRGR